MARLSDCADIGWSNRLRRAPHLQAVGGVILPQGTVAPPCQPREFSLTRSRWMRHP